MQTILILRHSRLECWQHKFAGIMAFARKHNWQLQTVDCSAGNIRLPEILNFWKPAGCILEANGDQATLQPRAFGKIPLVCLDHSPKALQAGASVVRHDSAAIARLAAHELLSTGFQHIAVVGWKHTSYWQTDKIKSFCDVVKLNGFCAREFLVDADQTSSETKIQRQIKDWLSGLPTPCAIFGVHDLIAGHILSSAMELGRAVPHDLAIIGADDDPLICESTQPSMSSIRPDFQKSGLIAAELLHRRILSPATPPQLNVVPPICVVRRQSTRLPSITDTRIRAALERIRVEARSGLTAADVLAEFPCSRRRAEIRFRDAVGRSVLEEIQHVRFENALACLRRLDIPIGAIADFAGWPSALVLSRYVKAQTGKTLSELRQSILTANGAESR